MHQPGMINRLVGWIMQLGEIQTGDREQVAHGHHGFNLEYIGGLIKSQFCSEHAAVSRVHAFFYLQADNGRKMAVTQLGFDHGQQVVCLFLLDFHDGIAGDPEKFTGGDLHPRKQQIQVVADHVLKFYIGIAVIDTQKPWGEPFYHGYLDAGIVGGAATRVAQ